MVPADSEKGFVADRTSTLVGMARLRQLRILNGEASFTCPVALSLSLSVHLSTAQQTKVAQRAGGKTIAELTAFCKKLQDEKESVNSGNTSVITLEKEEDSQPVAHHPFLIKEKPDITIPPVIFPVS